MGWLASQGWGEPQNNAKAAMLWREAGNGGVAVSDYSLAWLYENGAGVPRDTNEAVRLYRRAAQGGIGSAAPRLMWLTLAATPPAGCSRQRSMATHSRNSSLRAC
ncbi:MAG: sel1 repeat family protein [Burkholderiales bacterium]|nr:sel1 repeat family protein [Burkholderiales bacterium]